jgi:hypothetical protein
MAKLREEIHGLRIDLAKHGKDAVTGHDRRMKEIELRQKQAELHQKAMAPILARRQALAGFDLSSVLPGLPNPSISSGVHGQIAGLHSQVGKAWTTGLQHWAQSLLKSAGRLDQEVAHRDKLTTSVDKQQTVIDASTQKLNDMQSALDTATTALDDLKQQSADFGSSVAGNFAGSPFGHGATYAMQQFNRYGAKATAFSSDLAALQAEHISSALYQQLASSGDTLTAHQLAGMTPDKFGQFQSAFAGQQAALGALSGQAGGYVYGDQIAAQNSAVAQQLAAVQAQSQLVATQNAELASLNAQITSLNDTITKNSVALEKASQQGGTKITVNDKSGNPAHTAREVARHQRHRGRR